MGYYVNIIGADATLPAEKLDEAYARLVELNDHDEWKSGGTTTERWFAWLDRDYPTKFSTAQQILEEVGFEIETNEDGLGNISIMGYDGKTGCEDIMLWAIADLFEAGSEIEWRGEENETWLQRFGGGKKMTQVGGVVTYPEDKAVEYMPFDYGKMRAHFEALAK